MTTPSIIDILAAVPPVAEMAGRVSQLDAILTRRATGHAMIADGKQMISETWDPEWDLELEVAHALAEDLSVTERREVTALLAPIWRAGHLRAAVSEVLRLGDTDAWMITLEALVEVGMLPVVDASDATVWTLTKRPPSWIVRHPHGRRYTGCMSTRVEDLWDGWVWHTCHTCGRTARIVQWPLALAQGTLDLDFAPPPEEAETQPAAPQNRQLTLV